MVKSIENKNKVNMEECDDQSYTMGQYDDVSDKELQLAFEKGLLKPGLNQEIISYKKKEAINDRKALLEKLDTLKLDLTWVESLDVTCKPAVIAPELALQLEEHKSKKLNSSQVKDDDLIYDDFAREMLLYRLAQSAVLEGIPKLHKLGIPTKRPQDYFAEMAKSDDHMHKVRQKLKQKENRILFSEKARKLRELKKFGKKVQVQRQLEKQAEKRKILDQLKKFKKGKTDSLDFLDDKPEKMDANGIMKSKSQLKKELKELSSSRNHRDKKFGLNGNKKGWKRNTAKDLDGPLDSVGKKITKAPRGKPKKRFTKRPGKNVRAEQQQKSKSNVNKKGNKNN